MPAPLSSDAGTNLKDNGSAEQNISVLPTPSVAARPRKRHWGLAFSFLVFVIVPVVLAVGYLYTRALDQYASTVGFSVRAAEMTSPIEILGGMADLSGSSSSDADILYEFLQSQELVRKLDATLDLKAIYAGSDRDPVFSFSDEGAIEDLVAYWNRMASVNYDSSTGLIELRVLAFSADDAKRVADAAFEESTQMINRLSAIAQEDTIRYAKTDLDLTVERLTETREDLTALRTREQIVDPNADIQTQMGLLASLQEQLAEALISINVLRETTNASDNRVMLAERRIEIIKTQIDEERAKFGIGSSSSTDAPYANVMAEFERLTIEREITEQAYASALATYHSARAEARRQSRYLAAYLQPTLAETAEYPKRFEILLTLAFMLLVGWSIAVMIYYSVRDRH